MIDKYEWVELKKGRVLRASEIICIQRGTRVTTLVFVRNAHDSYVVPLPFETFVKVYMALMGERVLTFEQMTADSVPSEEATNAQS